MAHIDSAKVLKKSKMFFSRAGNDPYFDWGTILIVSFAAALVFIVVSVRLFISINVGSNNGGTAGTATGSDAGSSAPVAQGSLDTADLVGLINIFQSKKAQGTVYDATYPGPSDPAIPVKPAGKSPAAAAVPK